MCLSAEQHKLNGWGSAPRKVSTKTTGVSFCSEFVELLHLYGFVTGLGGLKHKFKGCYTRFSYHFEVNMVNFQNNSFSFNFALIFDLVLNWL